jgi:hypothetical protein
MPSLFVRVTLFYYMYILQNSRVFRVFALRFILQVRDMAAFIVSITVYSCQNLKKELHSHEEVKAYSCNLKQRLGMRIRISSNELIV